MIAEGLTNKMHPADGTQLLGTLSMKLQLCALAGLLIAAAGCAASGGPRPARPAGGNSPAAPNEQPNDNSDFDLLEEELAEQTIEVADPLEPFNRIMFQVNDVFYFWLLKPCAVTCKAVIPHPARVGIRNFFRNLTTPARLANCLLQGKNDSAGIELRRFWINTTEGVLGFGDPAKDKRGLLPQQEDLGQSLAVHGMGDGFYIVWPVLGPSTLRDSIGMLGDQFLNPIRYVEPAEVSVGISVGRFTNESSFHLGEYEQFKSAATEPYVAMRQAYIQYRRDQIRR